MSTAKIQVLVIPKESPGIEDNDLEKNSGFLIERSDTEVRLYSLIIPNIKARAAYYLWTVDDNRIYHLQSVDNHDDTCLRVPGLILNLGNSFVLPRKPRIRESDFKTQWFKYLALKVFGLKQVSPGVLIDISSDQLSDEFKDVELT